MNFATSLYPVIFGGMAILSILADVGGLCLCFAYRHLSRKLLIAAAGFAGLIVAVATNQFASTVIGGIDQDPDLRLIIIAIGLAIGVIARFLIVIGLAWAFGEIRRKLMVALEPPDGFR